MQLPNFQATDDVQITFNQMQDKWSSILNPLLLNPLNNVSILKNVQLGSGLNSIPHLLSRNLKGWFIVRQRGPATFYDQQDSNQSPQLTLKLNSSAAVSVDLVVF
jgi:hypothetical protein